MQSWSLRELTAKFLTSLNITSAEPEPAKRAAAVQIYYPGLYCPVVAEKNLPVHSELWINAFDAKQASKTVAALKLFNITAQVEVRSGRAVAVIPVQDPAPAEVTAEYKKLTDIGAFLMNEYFTVKKDDRLEWKRKPSETEQKALLSFINQQFGRIPTDVNGNILLGANFMIRFEKMMAEFLKEEAGAIASFDVPAAAL
jgi:hypothetical protein